jgi:GAF domain-containing protein
MLAVPLRKDGTLLGSFIIYRQEVRLFSDKQIALLENFATQAVIAIENARLLTETREALEQQTATAEVLQVINSSPGDLAPVFDAMLENAMRLCEIAFGLLYTRDGEYFHAVAARGLPPALAEYSHHPFKVPPGSTFDELVAGVSVVQIPDIATDDRPASDARRALIELGGGRTGLAIALRKDDEFLGAFWFYRQEVRPFTDKQIALLQNFAAQAVIAMENARLITETREALEQQTATAEVLQVINSSPSKLTPVFDAILDKAMHLCEAAFGELATSDGTRFSIAAVRGETPDYVERRRQTPPDPSKPGTISARILNTRYPVHVLDIAAEEAHLTGLPSRRVVSDTGVRTVLAVPLLRDEQVIGFIGVYRREVRAFTDKQIALLQNFAAQAVIAMENARLITETREALEQQTATAEVLQVINASPGNLIPVFDAMLERALLLCNSSFGALHTFDGEEFHSAATRFRLSTDRRVVARTLRPDPGSAIAQLVAGALVVHIPDVVNTDEYRAGLAPRVMIVEQVGARTALWVALRKDDTLLGAFTIYRREVRPFSDKQIALVQNFAAQAVIAMENARLLTEQREALEQQTATAEVLQVINSSPGDLTPVFDTMLGKAMRLCEAGFGELYGYDGERFHPLALLGVPAAYTSFKQQRENLQAMPDPGSMAARVAAGEEVVHILDLKDSEVYRNGDLNRRAMVDIGGARTAISLALRKDGELRGGIVIYRCEVRAFSEKQIALLKNFAAQAVIAMENARLITETREALEQQTATAEVLQVINSSPGDLVPVFDAILEKAHILCSTACGSLELIDHDRIYAVAVRGFSEVFADVLRKGDLAANQPATGPLLAGEQYNHIIDVSQIDHPTFRGAAQEGLGTVLFTPLRKDGALLGMIASARREVRPFLEKEIALLEGFAAQAVIAMENARLLNEVRQRQEELRITFENMGDGVALFDETPRLVAWNRHFQQMFNLPDDLLKQHRTYEDHLRFLAERGDFGSGLDAEEQLRALVINTDKPSVYERTRPDGRVLEIRRNPVPSGGFVVIFSDITERKRNEAELRAARDAAEEASRTIEAAYRDLKAAQANLIQAEKMASLGQLTAGIAHEIKNPLNFVNNFAMLSVDWTS